MILTVLGCGTSSGVPLIHCSCRVCRSRNVKNKRLRASAWIHIQDKDFLIDTATDLRQQALREKIPKIDAVLYTHPHADHIHGIDELRSFNFVQRETIPLYGNHWTCTELRQKFGYIFQPGKPEGGGIPQLELNEFDAKSAFIEACGIKIIPISLQHGSKECVAFRFDSVAYVTDCSYIPKQSLNRLQDLDVLVLDCVKVEKHPTHFNLDQALETVEILRPKKTYLTHLGHDFEYGEWSKKLPKGVALAFDGLKIKIGDKNDRRRT